VSLGDRTIINRDTLLDGRGGLTIGSDVNVSPEVAVLTAEHDPQSPGFTGRDRAVRIGDRCWLATRVLVLPGTVIDDGCVLAAGAVAHGHLAGDVIYAGNPVRAIRDRSPDAQHDLLPYRRFLQ
jgi:maltose O-acetyltransferase